MLGCSAEELRVSFHVSKLASQRMQENLYNLFIITGIPIKSKAPNPCKGKTNKFQNCTGTLRLVYHITESLVASVSNIRFDNHASCDCFNFDLFSQQTLLRD